MDEKKCVLCVRYVPKGAHCHKNLSYKLKPSHMGVEENGGLF